MFAGFVLTVVFLPTSSCTENEHVSRLQFGLSHQLKYSCLNHFKSSTINASLNDNPWHFGSFPSFTLFSNSSTGTTDKAHARAISSSYFVIVSKPECNRLKTLLLLLLLLLLMILFRRRRRRRPLSLAHHHQSCLSSSSWSWRAKSSSDEFI